MEIKEYKTASLHSRFSVNGEISDKDTRFMSITIDVLHTGENLNGSYFSKEVVDNCVDSIKNTPVLGFVKRDKYTNENDFLRHEHVLTKTENGVEEFYLGHAFGVIPESCNPRWFTKLCDDGQEREFLQVDALLWEKFSDSTSILRRDSEKDQSMELNVYSVDGHEEDDGLFHFDTFQFDGCCMLGEGVQPAMTGANVKINDVQFAMDEFTKAVQSELNDKFTTFTKLVNDKTSQGGVRNMPETDFAQTVMEQFSDMAAMVNEHATTKNRWGDDVPRYYMADIQDNEVIVVDSADNYRYYGFTFTINGDKPEIDFENGSRKKIRFENYEEGSAVPEGGFEFGEHIAKIEEAAFEKVSAAEEKVSEAEQAKEQVETDYAQVKADFDEIKPKYDEYVLDEEKRKNDEINAAKDAKFAEYEDELSEVAEFAALKEKKDELSVDDIEKECAVLYVKANRSKSNFSAQNDGAAVVGVMNDSDDEANCWVSTKYGRIPVGR